MTNVTTVTCRLAAKNRDQLRNPTLCSRVWATFTFLKLNQPRRQKILFQPAEVQTARHRSIYVANQSSVCADRRDELCINKPVVTTETLALHNIFFFVYTLGLLMYLGTQHNIVDTLSYLQH